MTLEEISYMVLETIREGHIVDDERLDTRLIKDWIKMKRSQYLKNMKGNGGNPGGNFNTNNKLGLNLYQLLPLTVSVVDPVTDAGDYPYLNGTTQLYKIVESVEEVPDIVEGKRGPMILSIESQDQMKLAFSSVSYDHMRVAGNGRFNNNFIFGAIRDNKLWFKYNSFFDTYTNVIVRAIFEDPTDVPGFDEETDKYPADPGLIEFIKNGILDKDIRAWLGGISDEVNDASGDIN